MSVPFVLLRALLAIACLFAAGPATAREAREAQVPPVALTACAASAAALPADTLAAAIAYRAYDCSGAQTAMAGSEFWTQSVLPQPVQANGWRLRWTSTWQDRADIAFVYADGRHQVVTLRQDMASPFIETGAIVQIPVPVASSELVAVYMRVSGAANLRGILLNPELMTADVAAAKGRTYAWLYGAFLGLCAALLIYNMMIWTALRQSYLLAYCAMLTAIFVYAASSSGLLADLIPTLANNDRLRINYASLIIVACCALGFARTFLEPEIFTRPMRFAAWGAVGVMASAGLAFAILAPWSIKLLDSLYFASFGVGLCYLLYAFARGMRLGGLHSRLYIMSWSAPILLSAVRMLHGFGFVPQSFLLDNSTLMAMTVESILSSMIIAYRIRTVQQDRDSALRGEVEARLLADTDPLTGLLNRRALLRIACPLTLQGNWRLVLIDIDHFKRVNDLAGHDVGDEVLAAVARLIQSSLRPGAVAARIGGEEFAILFPSPETERRTYASLLSRVQSTPLPGNLRITVSMGIADGPLGAEETLWRQLYREADTALYAAKQRGRNRQVHANDLRKRGEAPAIVAA